MSDVAADTEDQIVQGRYRVLHFIGGGAMARVYKVEHLKNGTVHAMKAQRIHAPEDSQVNAMEAAENEVSLLQTLSHASLPRVTDWFRDATHVYIVMDYVEGRNLKSLLEAQHNSPFDVTTVVEWGIQVSDVLEYLHAQKPPIIFRDVKPSNLMRRPNGQICLVDFGIARQAKSGSPTDTMTFGSPGYAPPEQYGQGQTDARSDIYALGATLHHLITGRDPSLTPFRLPPARSVNPFVPSPLERLLMKCLELEPLRRPQTATELGNALKSIRDLLERAEVPKAVVTMPNTPLVMTDETTQDLLAAAREDMARHGTASPIARAAGLFSDAPATQQLREIMAPPVGVQRSASASDKLPPTYSVFQIALLACAMLSLLTLLPGISAALAPATPKEQEAFGRLASLRGALALASALPLAYGALKATRRGMMMVAAGLLALVMLAAALFLPGRTGPFLLSCTAVMPLTVCVAWFWRSIE